MLSESSKKLCVGDTKEVKIRVYVIYLLNTLSTTENQNFDHADRRRIQHIRVADLIISNSNSDSNSLF